MAATGLISVPSVHSPQETARRLVHALTARGLSVFARVDHSKNAAQVGLELRPTELILFGNPKGGTPLMLENQVAGIDLPVKALIWQDAEGRVWLTYNDARWLADRHGLGTVPAVEVMADGLAAIAAEATGKAPG